MTGEESYVFLVWHSSIAESSCPTCQIDLASCRYIGRNARHLFAGEPLSVAADMLEDIEVVLGCNSSTASGERKSKKLHDYR